MSRSNYEDIPSTSRGVDEVGTRRVQPAHVSGERVCVEDMMEEEMAVCKSRRIQSFVRRSEHVARAQAALDDVIIELLPQSRSVFIRPGFWSCSRDAFLSLLRETDHEMLVDEWIQDYVTENPEAVEDGLIHVGVVVLLAREVRNRFDQDISVYRVIDRIPYIWREDSLAWMIVKDYPSGLGVWLENEHFHAVRITNFSTWGIGMIESTDDEISELSEDSDETASSDDSTSESFSGEDLDDTSCSVSESHACAARRECNSRCVFDDNFRDRYRKRSKPVKVAINTLPLEWVMETPLENSQPRVIRVNNNDVSDCVRRAFKLLAASGSRAFERASCVERGIDPPDPTGHWLKLVQMEHNIAKYDPYTYGTSARGMLAMLNLFTNDGFQVCAVYKMGKHQFLMRPGNGSVASSLSRLHPHDVPLGYVIWCETNHCKLRLFTACEAKINLVTYKKQKYGFLVDILAASATSLLAGLGILIGGSGVAKL